MLTIGWIEVIVPFFIGYNILILVMISIRRYYFT
jgi:hypothetical protein